MKEKRGYLTVSFRFKGWKDFRPTLLASQVLGPYRCAADHY
jgi:hypothetical protein